MPQAACVFVADAGFVQKREQFASGLLLMTPKFLRVSAKQALRSERRIRMRRQAKKILSLFCRLIVRQNRKARRAQSGVTRICFAKLENVDLQFAFLNQFGEILFDSLQIASQPLVSRRFADKKCVRKLSCNKFVQKFKSVGNPNEERQKSFQPKRSLIELFAVLKKI